MQLFDAVIRRRSPAVRGAALTTTSTDGAASEADATTSATGTRGMYKAGTAGAEDNTGVSECRPEIGHGDDSGHCRTQGRRVVRL